MIHEKELRIGVWVEINKKAVYMDRKLFHAYFLGWEEYQPLGIILTEEWLIDFGFKTYGDFYRSLKGYGQVIIAKIDNAKFALVDVNEEYIGEAFNFVHELQNIAHSLYKIELHRSNVNN